VQVVDVQLWKDMVTGRGLLDGKNPRQQWSDLKSGLQVARYISEWNGLVWLVPNDRSSAW
jgi:hypothetical protein